MTSERPGPEFSTALLVAAVAVTGWGFLVGGPLGAIIGVAAVIALPSGTGSLLPGLAGGAALVVAALATVLEAPLGPAFVGMAYAAERPVANAAARLAALAAFIAVAMAAVTERSKVSMTARPAAPQARVDLRDLPRSGRGLLPYLPALLLTAAEFAVSSGAPIAGAPALLAENLRAGLGYTIGGGELRAPAAVPPLEPVVAAFSPFSPALAALVIACLTVVTLTRLGQRSGGPRAAMIVGVVGALLPAVTGHRIADGLTVLFVSAALLRAWPADVDRSRAGVAGLLLAGAALARADAIIVIPLVAVWLGWSLGRRAAGPLVALVLAAAATLAPWHLWLYERVGTWWPAAAIDLRPWVALTLPFAAVIIFRGDAHENAAGAAGL
ncbi:MAG: hypothetical protein M3O70_03250 [Actinomycetota bacterium]|nr:hypothetical protein [Actinomycetota bacterium]